VNPPKKGEKKKNPGINPGQYVEKGREKKTLSSPSKKGGKKNPGQPAGPRFQDLDLRTWVSRPQSQDLGFRTQIDARNASYNCLIFFPSFFSAPIVTFLFPVT
jgi:hypothetical protein